MKHVRKLLALTVALVAVGAFAAAGPASAATGSGTSTVTIDGTACTVTFDWDTGANPPPPVNPPPPAGSPAVLSNFATSGCAATVVEPPTTLSVAFGPETSPGSGTGPATVNGVIRVNVFGVNCTYNVTNLSGTWTFIPGGTPPPPPDIVRVTGSGTLVKTPGSSFLCPSPVDFDIEADFEV
ncbi:MAG TPA: hypothetical protein VMF31_03845 [Solirubrobacterales bacterium]|nr:hypothetical protein [Solirubrobacterales bacterium]